MWTRKGRGVGHGYHVLFEKPPKVEEDGSPGVAAYPMQSRNPQGERGGSSAKVQLAKAREAHQRALATTMVLEEEIE